MRPRIPRNLAVGRDDHAILLFSGNHTLDDAVRGIAEPGIIYFDTAPHRTGLRSCPAPVAIKNDHHFMGTAGSIRNQLPDQGLTSSFQIPMPRTDEIVTVYDNRCDRTPPECPWVPVSGRSRPYEQQGNSGGVISSRFGCGASHPIARLFTDPLPGLLIDLVTILGNRKDHPALRAGQDRANSAENQTKLAPARTASHAFFPLSCSEHVIRWKMHTVLLYHRA